MLSRNIARRILLWSLLLLGAMTVSALAPWDADSPTTRCIRGGIPDLPFAFESGSSVEGRFSVVPFGLVCDYADAARTTVVSVAAMPLATPFVAVLALVAAIAAIMLAVRRRTLEEDE